MKTSKRNRVLSSIYEFFVYKILFSRVYCPVHVKKYAELPECPFLVCSNHCSHMDTPLIIYATGYRFKDFSALAALDHFFSSESFNYFHTLVFNLIPVDRKASRKGLLSMIGRSKRAIKAGHKLVAYPEGTRSKTGEMGEFKKGIPMLALKLQIPIIPIYIKDSFKRMPKDSIFLRPGPVEVHIDAPMDISAYQGIANRKAYSEITDDLYQRIDRLRKNAEGKDG